MKNFLLLMFLGIYASGCAYRLGYENRTLPQNIKSVYVPVFLNDTLETGQEVPFTNELIRELKRSGVASVVSEEKSEAVLTGRIMRISNTQFATEERGLTERKDSGLVYLPRGTSLTTQYLMRIRLELRLKNKSGKTLWKQWFADERLYSAPIIALPGVNSATALYGVSERQRVTEELAQIMMNEAVGRLTENF